MLGCTTLIDPAPVRALYDALRGTLSPTPSKSSPLPRMVLIVATLLSASCAAQTHSCSDPEVGAKVKELVLQRLSENYGLTAMYDLPATRFDLRAIRTVASDERRVDCRTELAMTFELNAELKAGLAKPSGNPTEAQMMRSMLGNSSRTVDLRYSVERTDDGRDLYVTMQGF